jgi:hypothetical protein
MFQSVGSPPAFAPQAVTVRPSAISTAISEQQVLKSIFVVLNENSGNTPTTLNISEQVPCLPQNPGFVGPSHKSY